MILSEFAYVPTNNRNYRRFLDIGYKFNIGDVILSKISHLSKNSESLVLAKCDVCGREKNLEYRFYLKNFRNGEYYTCSRKCGNGKTISTNLKRYGVEYPIQNKDIKNKLKKYFMLEYGVDHPMMLDVYADKMRQTKLDRHGDENYVNVDKTKQTKLWKYGNENYVNINKIKQTKLEKYGDENYNNYDKYVETCLLKYGETSNMKVEELFIKNLKSRHTIKLHDESGLYYQGSYELDFINYCVGNSIEVKRGPVIDYNMCGIDRKYYSDFYLPINNFIIEIKSSYTFDKDYEENLLKREYSIKSGYSFLFIIDKNYDELEKIIYTK